MLCRQECHEYIRELSQQAGDRVKMEGKDNDLIQRSGFFYIFRRRPLGHLFYSYTQFRLSSNGDEGH